jgi:HAD superfamily hydrolase (TIGR01549 family)
MNYLIFDVDGTLIDTEKMYLLPLRKTLIKNGYQVTYEDVKKVFGITAADALQILGVKNIDQVLNEWFGQIKDYQQYAHVYPGIIDALVALHSHKDNRLAIATSKLRDEFHRDVSRFGLDKYFDAFVFSDEIKRGKPAPDMILKGMDKLGAKPQESIYIGDTRYDFEAAKAASVKFALAGWRTERSSEFKDVDYYLTTPADLLKL